MNDEYIPKGWKAVGSQWVRMYKGDGHGNCFKPNSKVVVRGFTQVQSVDCHQTTPPTPARISARKMIVTVTNEKSLPVFRVDISKAIVQPPSRRKLTFAPPGLR